MKLLNIPIDYKIRVDGLLYDQLETTDINEGDLVLDLQDGTYGVCDMRIEDKIAIKHGPVAEVGVPITRVRKLISSIHNNSEN